MNLKSFLDHKTDCPLCNSPLVTFFHSKKRQTMKYEDNRMVVVFRMDGIKRGQSNFKVGYSFSLENNTCFIEFYDKEDIRMDDSPNHLRKRFKELDQNLKQYIFYKSCETCHKYNYSSNKLTFSKGIMDDIIIASEYFGLVVPHGSEYKVCRLMHDYHQSTTSFTYSKQKGMDGAYADGGFGTAAIVTVDGIIKFTSAEETINRIGKLVIFS